MKTTTYSCDVKVCSNEPEKKGFSIQVIFTTEQTEGRSVKPYLANVQLDICDSCLNNVCKGNYIFANGAQGSNEYYFKSKQD